MPRLGRPAVQVLGGALTGARKYRRQGKYGPTYTQDRDASTYFKKHNLARLWGKEKGEGKEPAAAGAGVQDTPRVGVGWTSAAEKTGPHFFEPGAVLDVCVICGKDRDDGEHYGPGDEGETG